MLVVRAVELKRPLHEPAKGFSRRRCEKKKNSHQPSFHRRPITNGTHQGTPEDR